MPTSKGAKKEKWRAGVEGRHRVQLVCGHGRGTNVHDRHVHIETPSCDLQWKAVRTPRDSASL